MKFAEWIKKKLFFSVDKADKTYLRKTILETDHVLYGRMMIFIAALQLVMIAYTLIKYGINFNANEMDSKRLVYLCSYIALAAGLIINRLLLGFFFRRKNENAYFAVSVATVFLFFAWATTISILDSLIEAELTTFAYVTLAITAIVIIEPWIYILFTIAFSTGLIIAVLNLLNRFSPFVIISALSIMVLTALASTFNFNTRVRAIFLGREVEGLNKELKLMVYHDDLTKTYNRRFLTEHIDDKLKVGVHAAGIIMFDVDDFKKVNDDFGHQVGDAVLASLGSVIHSFMEENPGYAVRYGGEEFLILLDSVTEKELLEKSEQLRKLVKQISVPQPFGEDVRITISLGACLAARGLSFETLIGMADDNLYSAKESGKDKCVVGKKAK